MGNTKPGQIYGWWTTLHAIPSPPMAKKRWLCKCKCGTIKNVDINSIRSGGSTSCGCRRIQTLLKRFTTHKLSYTSIYHIWYSMLDRCNSPTNSAYRNYGARGIKVCPRWQENILNFVSDMGPRPSGMSLDRIDNNGPYSPDNCRWATRLQQGRNKRNNIRITFNGQNLPLSEWAQKIGRPRSCVYYRWQQGMPVEKILDPNKNHRT
jgi:hypothetical protein